MTEKNFLISLFFLISINLNAQDWFTNFDDAKELASINDLNILLVFQGSDWCGPCMKLDKKIWSTETFQILARDHFVMVQADFPKRKSNQLSETLKIQNNHLADLYNKQGYFPLAVLLNPEGDILGKMGYEKILPTEYFNKLKSFE